MFRLKAIPILITLNYFLISDSVGLYNIKRTIIEQIKQNAYILLNGAISFEESKVNSEEASQSFSIARWHRSRSN